MKRKHKKETIVPIIIAFSLELLDSFIFLYKLYKVNYNKEYKNIVPGIPNSL